MIGHRFKFSELSINRISAGIWKRLMAIPEYFMWRFSETGNENRENLSEYRNIHQGERCFIMANGPGLVKVDLDKLKNEFTFGLNRIYLLFNQISFKPTYFISVNDLMLEQYGNEMKCLAMPKFVDWKYRDIFDGSSNETNFLFSRFALRDDFQEEITKPIYEGGTVTYVAMQLAYYMGFTEVILVGLDFSYKAEGIPNEKIVRDQETDEDHFHPNYLPRGDKWQAPDLGRNIIAFEQAKDAFESDGRRILDASIDGKCEVFSKVKFDSLFE